MKKLSSLAVIITGLFAVLGVIPICGDRAIAAEDFKEEVGIRQDDDCCPDFERVLKATSRIKVCRAKDKCPQKAIELDAATFGRLWQGAGPECGRLARQFKIRCEQTEECRSKRDEKFPEAAWTCLVSQKKPIKDLGCVKLTGEQELQRCKDKDQDTCECSISTECGCDCVPTI